MKIHYRHLGIAIGALLVVTGLVGCPKTSGGGSSPVISGPPVSDGTLTFNHNAIAVITGSERRLKLTLEKGGEATVTLSSSNPAVAALYPESCNLSSNNPKFQSCEITVYGKSSGSATVTASAASLNSKISASVTVGPTSPGGGGGGGGGGTSIPGNLAFAPTSVKIRQGYTNTVTLILEESSAVSSLVVNLVSSNSAIATVASPTCQLSTAVNNCTVTLHGVANGTAQLTASASGYTAPSPVSITVSDQPVKPNISFNEPFINLAPSHSQQVILEAEGGSGFDPVAVSLASANTGVATLRTNSCSLSADSPTCTLRVDGVALGGTTINATATGYTIPALTVNVTAAPTPNAARSFTFVNNCSADVWVGFTGGATESLVSGSGSGSTSCAPTLANATCPTGSTCRDAGAAGYICYFDSLDSPTGYQVPKGNSKIISVSSSSYDPANGFVWSGNMFARQGCDSNGANCTVADCKADSTGKCTTSAQAPVTLAEITMLRNGNDSYDISIINGVNVGIEFGANNVGLGTSPYTCGVAGSTTVMPPNGTQTLPAALTLPAASWEFTPVTPVAYPASTPTAGNSYFNYVSGDGTGTDCSTNPGICTGSQVCGYTMNAVLSAGGVQPVANYKLTCGTRLGYWTAAQIWFYNQDTLSVAQSKNLAPFSFDAYQTSSNLNPPITPAPATSPYDNGDLFKCASPPFYTGFANIGGQTQLNSCGCTNWDGSDYAVSDLGFGSYYNCLPAQWPSCPNETCQVSNPYWVNTVLPNLVWLKQGCPTCYVYPYDDKTSSYTCQSAGTTSTVANTANYTVTFCPTT